jgi:hypothetical protein
VTTSGANALSQEFTADRAVLRQTLSKLSLQNRFSGWTGVPYMSEYQAELIEAGDPFALEAAVLEIMNAGIFQDTESAEGQARQKARALRRPSTLPGSRSRHQSPGRGLPACRGAGSSSCRTAS